MSRMGPGRKSEHPRPFSSGLIESRIPQMASKSPHFTSSVSVCSATGRHMYRVPCALAGLMCHAGIAKAGRGVGRPVFQILLLRVAPTTNKLPTPSSLRDFCSKSPLYPRRLGDVDRSQATFTLRHVSKADVLRIHAERVDQHVYPASVPV